MSSKFFVATNEAMSGMSYTTECVCGESPTACYEAWIEDNPNTVWDDLFYYEVREVKVELASKLELKIKE